MLAELLTKHGYDAFHIGKWHLDAGGHNGRGQADGGFATETWYDLNNFYDEVGRDGINRFGSWNRGLDVFIEMVKISLVDGTVVNIPAGTDGVITDVIEGETPLYTIRCDPATTQLQPSFRVSADEAEFLGNVALAGEVDRTALPGLNEQELYDDDMPGFMRADSGYLLSEDPVDQSLAAEYLLFKRTPWTAWQIEVRFYAGGQNIVDVTGVFRTSWQDGQECEQFTLLPKDQDYAYVQVRMFSASRVRCYAHVPAEIEIDIGQKRITIYLLCRVEFTKIGMKVYELLG